MREKKDPNTKTIEIFFFKLVFFPNHKKSAFCPVSLLITQSRRTEIHKLHRCHTQELSDDDDDGFYIFVCLKNVVRNVIRFHVLA